MGFLRNPVKLAEKSQCHRDYGRGGQVFRRSLGVSGGTSEMNEEQCGCVWYLLGLVFGLVGHVGGCSSMEIWHWVWVRRVCSWLSGVSVVCICVCVSNVVDVVCSFFQFFFPKIYLRSGNYGVVITERGFGVVFWIR